MANDGTDIEIGLKTTGDTTGADEVKDSLFGVRDAAKEAEAQADLEAVKAKQAAEVQREQAAALREIADAQQRIIAANLAQTVGEISKQFHGMSPEIDLVLESSQNFLGVLASTGDPIKATLAVVATSIGAVVTAYRQAGEQSKQIAKTEQEQLKHIAELRAAFVQQVRTEGLVNFFQKELDSLGKYEAALGRIAKINASERALKAAQEQAANSAAARGGEDANTTAMRAAQQEIIRQVNEVNAGIEDQRKAVALAQEKSTTLALEAKALINQQGEGGKEAMAAADAAQKAADHAEKMTLDLAADQEVANNQIKALWETGREKLLTQLTAQTEASSTETAEAFKTLLDGIKEKQNGIVSQPTAGIMDGLAVILADHKVTMDEAPKLESLLRLFTQTTEDREAAVQNMVQTFITVQMASKAKADENARRIRNLEDQLLPK